MIPSRDYRSRELNSMIRPNWVIGSVTLRVCGTPNAAESREYIFRNKSQVSLIKSCTCCCYFSCRARRRRVRHGCFRGRAESKCEQQTRDRLHTSSRYLAN